MYRWARMVAVCALALACTGCLRYHADLRVDAAGTVSGRLVVAFRQDLATSAPQHYDVPPALRGKVAVAPYDADGYLGDSLAFDRLTLDEVGVLFAGGQRDGAVVQLDMTRSGDEVSVRGTVFFPDASGLGSRDGFDARIALSFAGARSVTGNGAVSGREVTWSPSPGELTSLRAQAVYPHPAPVAAAAAPQRSRTPVAAVLAGLVAVLAGLVLLLLIRLLRRRPAAVLPTPVLPTPVLPAPVPGLVTAAVVPAAVAVPTGMAPTGVPQQPALPPGPGLSPQSTLPLPTVPIPNLAPPDGAPHSPAGWPNNPGRVGW